MTDSFLPKTHFTEHRKEYTEADVRLIIEAHEAELRRQHDLIQTLTDALKEIVEAHQHDTNDKNPSLVAARAAISKAQSPVSLKQVATKHGIQMPENYISTIDDAIASADGVLMNEQAALLLECRSAIDSLLAQKPMLSALQCGSTTLGNLKASLYAYRPQGIFGGAALNKAKEQS